MRNEPFESGYGQLAQHLRLWSSRGALAGDTSTSDGTDSLPTSCDVIATT